MNTGPLVDKISVLESWIERAEGQASLLPLRWGGRVLLAEEHGVKGLPTLVLFERGEDVRRHAGTLSYADLEALAKRQPSF